MRRFNKCIESSIVMEGLLSRFWMDKVAVQIFDPCKKQVVFVWFLLPEGKYCCRSKRSTSHSHNLIMLLHRLKMIVTGRGRSKEANTKSQIHKEIKMERENDQLLKRMYVLQFEFT